MDAPFVLRTGFRRAVASCRNPAKRQVVHHPRRFYASSSEPQGEIKAADPIRFSNDGDQFARPKAQIIEEGGGQRKGDDRRGGGFRTQGRGQTSGAGLPLLRRIRVVPASPSYFTATPKYTDDLLYLSALLRKHQTLPVLDPGHAPRVAWKTMEQYKTELAEPVRAKGYNMLLQLLKRLNYIHPALLPLEVQSTLERYKRSVQPHLNKPKPIVIDKSGRARAVGRRKSSRAVVFLVEGEGECLVNGKSLTEYFGRLYHRESAVWALKATRRLDKYNVFALVEGGGSTGQADAITLGVAKALLAHEPDLKPALRRAGVVHRDPRKVERKKPGKLKARKMPTWVKR